MITQNYLNCWFSQMNEESKYLVILDKDDKFRNGYIFLKEWENERLYSGIREYHNIFTTRTPLPIDSYDWHNEDGIFAKIVQRDEWLKYIKNTIITDINRQLALNTVNNLTIIKNEVVKDKWKYVSFHYECDAVLLIGASATDEDYYYIAINKDLTITAHTCVGGYKIIDKDELSNDYSVLNYLIDNDKSSLIDKVLEYCRNNVDVLITEL